MISDKVKRACLFLSFGMATTIFICLYFVNNSRDLPAIGSETSLNGTNLKEYKGIYNNYKPGNMSNVYINVFSTRDMEDNIHDLSSFDLLSDWDTDFDPVLDANIQFHSRDRQTVGQPINIPNATISVRGNPKVGLKSYRVKYMDGSGGFQGQSVFNINKYLNDPSRIANKLAHDLIIDVDNISGFRTNFIEVYVRDDSLGDEEGEFITYGLYTHIEQPNKSYLRSRGLDEKASLYRAEDFHFQLDPELKNVDDPQYDKQLFETVLTIREGKDHSKLIEMLMDINDKNKVFDHVFNTYFDEDNYLTWLSINILLGNTDAMSEGFLLYNPSNSSVFYFLPWKFTGIFQWMDNEVDSTNIYEKMEDVELHRKYMEKEENLDKLKAKMEELISDSFSPGKVKYLIKYYKPILLEMMDKYPDNVLSQMPLDEYLAYLGQIDERIIMNYNEFIKRYD